MEELKSLIPSGLKLAISDSTTDDLPRTCGSLLDFLNPLPQFQQLLRELADPELGLRRKSADAALEFKKKGNECFRSGDFSGALRFYSQALKFAPVGSSDADKNFIATLYVNRASALHKLELLEECVHDCNRAVHHSPFHVKAWYRRAKANASLKNYKDSIEDLETALGFKISLSEKRHMEEELGAILALSKNSACSNFDNKKHLKSNGPINVEPSKIELRCITSEGKGKGMTSVYDLAPASLIHTEDPLSAVILKSCREAHCHFCFSELPDDAVFCLLCATPSYCSEICRDQADLEHRHECGGVNWPVVMPTDAVLAGRIIANFIQKRSHGILKTIETLEFTHHYSLVPPEKKMELHIYSVVLSFCLSQYFGSGFPFDKYSASQLVVLISQIRINSMALVFVTTCGYEIASFPGDGSSTEKACTCKIEQVSVAQAIYLIGRLFNHSCQPNLHAYFHTRKLFLRSTEFVPAGSYLEISYGPQVGQLDCQKRLQILKDQYFFRCQCIGCSKMNLPDIVMHAFCCSQPNCFGAIPESGAHQITDEISAKVPLPVLYGELDSLDEVAHALLQDSNSLRQLGKGCCLNCSAYHDLAVLSQRSRKSMVGIERLQNAIISRNVTKEVLSDSLRSLKKLRSIRHAYSKDVGQAHDTIAEAYSFIGDFESALYHCKASLEILKRLYHGKHIAIGNELVKMASIELSLGNHESAMNNLNQLQAIFSLHYGSHMQKILPQLGSLNSNMSKVQTNDFQGYNEFNT